MTNNIDKQSFGRGGAVFEDGTDVVTGDFCAIQVIEEATFSAITWAKLSGDTFTDIAIPAGTVLFGQISAFTLSGGKVLAYNAV